MKYEAIIGLEIHAELKTKSKMFCACDNGGGDQPPNTTVCPICLGHPGTLPVPNCQAIDWTILTGLALNCEINRLSKFDRKNYFYPDLPKGYQISQFDKPLAYNGYLEIDGQKVLITRIHLEEDTGKSTHTTTHTLLDFNRAGTPLMELVTEPVIKDAASAKKFGQAYQQILRYLNISNADMEKGEMRCEANVSVQAVGSWKYENGKIEPKSSSHKLNEKVEVKNINSFRALEKAINFEIARQTAALEAGQEIIPETRGWNENKSETFSQRRKETSADYRYFPEPDIPPLVIDDQKIANLKASLPELPENKKRRFSHEYGLTLDTAEVLVADKHLANWTEDVISELKAWVEATGDDANRQAKKLAKIAANWIIGELIRYLNNDRKSVQDLKLSAENFAELIALIYQEKITAAAGKSILEKMYYQGGDPTDIMTERGLEQLDDSQAITLAAKKVINDHKDQVAQYRQGKTALFPFFIGQVMAATRGKANPKVVRDILEKMLK